MKKKQHILIILSIICLMGCKKDELQKDYRGSGANLKNSQDLVTERTVYPVTGKYFDLSWNDFPTPWGYYHVFDIENSLIAFNKNSIDLELHLHCTSDPASVSDTIMNVHLNFSKNGKYQFDGTDYVLTDSTYKSLYEIRHISCSSDLGYEYQRTLRLKFHKK